MGADDPFAPPKASLEPRRAAGATEAVALRRAHLATEANLKAIGGLMMLGALGFGAGALTLGVEDSVAPAAGFGGTALVLAYSGWKLARLSRGGRVVAVLFSILLLAGFPMGTLLGLLSLLTLLGPKATTVLSEDYAAIIRRTPQLRYRSPTWMWILLGVLLLAIGALVFAVVR